MAAEVREILIRVRGETRDAERQLNQVKTSFTELNQAVELGKNIYRAAQAGAEALFAALDRAQTVEGVAKSFEQLQKQAGLLASDSLQKLRTATQGMVDDFTLMQQANQAVQLGLDPSTLDIMAEAATKLGAAVGRDATEAFSDLVTGVGRASPLILDNLGVTIKAEEAYERYAASLRKTTKELTEAEKAEAFQFAALEKIREKASELADVQLNAGQAADVLKTAFANLRDEVLLSLQSDTELRDILLELADIVRNFDTSNIVWGIREITKAASDAIEVLDETVSAVRRLMGAQDQAREATLDMARAATKTAEEHGDLLERVLELREAYARARGQLTGLSREHSVYSGEVQRAAGRSEAYRIALQEAEAALLGLGKETKETAKKNEETGKTFSKLTSDIKETKKAAEELFDVFDYSGSLFEGFFGKADQRQLSDQMQDVFREMEEAGKRAAEQQQQDLEDAYRESVDFWEDIFIGAVEGNVKDVLENMLIRAAIKFGAEIAAQLTASFSAQQLFGSGGFNWASLFQGQNIGPVADGAQYASLLQGGGYGAALGGLTTAGVAAGAYFTAVGYADAVDLTQKPQIDFTKQDQVQVGASTLSYSSAFAYGLGNALGIDQDKIKYFDPVSLELEFLQDRLGLDLSFLNFGSGKGRGQQTQDALLDALYDEGIVSTDEKLDLFGGGRFDLGDYTYSDGSTRGEFDGDERFLELGEGLAAVFGAADDSGIAEMFANALESAESFTAGLLTAQGILADLGVTTDQVKDQLTNAFLEGEISLEQYNEDMAAIDVLAQDVAVSVEEAASIMGDAIDGKPKDALRGLEIFFSTVRENGIQDIEALYGIIEAELGEGASAIFTQLREHGIDQFTEFSSLSSDQIRLIINILNQVPGAFSNIDSAASGSASNIEGAASRMVGSLSRVKREADETGISIKHLL